MNGRIPLATLCLLLAFGASGRAANADGETSWKHQPKVGHGNGNGNNGQSVNKDNLMALAKNRLDLLAQVNVNADGSFSRSHGEQSHLADSIEIIHLLPGRDSEGKLWKQMPACTVR